MDSKVLQKGATLIGVQKWGIVFFSAASIVCPTLGRRYQHDCGLMLTLGHPLVVQIVCLGYLWILRNIDKKIFFKSENFEKIAIMICVIHCFIENKIPKMMASHGAPLIRIVCPDDYHTYLWRMQNLECTGYSHVNPFSAGIEFRRQILTSKVDPRTGRVNIFDGRGSIGTQMKRKELTNTMILNWKIFQRFKVNPYAAGTVYTRFHPCLRWDKMPLKSTIYS